MRNRLLAIGAVLALSASAASANVFVPSPAVPGSFWVDGARFMVVQENGQLLTHDQHAAVDYLVKSCESQSRQRAYPSEYAPDGRSAPLMTKCMQSMLSQLGSQNRGNYVLLAGAAS